MARITPEDMRAYLKVYFICGSTNVKGSINTILQQAIDGGISLFQLREKGSQAKTNSEKLALAKELQQKCHKANIPFIVNDDVELALQINADGVHIGQEDSQVPYVREKIGDRILGVSAHTVAQAQKAIDQGADYLGVGPIFPTSTKGDAREACGPELITQFRKQGIYIPIVAIGGITIENASQLVEAQADGVSIISTISRADNPVEAAKQLKNIWKDQ